MYRINAQTANGVNAVTVNAVLQAVSMGRRSESEPSPFWRRLAEAWAEQDLPVSQNGIATKMNMSQGSVARWYHGEGLPELDTAIKLAERGRVCVDWLLTGRLPKYPISRDPVLREIFEICLQLEEPGRTAVLRTARGELLQKQAEELEQAKVRQRRA
jgi:transcriptional regulator with XRE-family HTH domain